MKNILLFLALALLSAIFITDTKAQSPTPKVGSDWVIKVINAGSLTTTKPTVTIPFYADQNVDYIQVMAVYATVSGDSCNLKIYPSPNGTTFTSTFVNRREAFQWENGDGTVKVMSDTVTLIKYPITHLKIICDTLTGMTTGTVTVYIKPHFK